MRQAVLGADKVLRACHHDKTPSTKLFEDRACNCRIHTPILPKICPKSIGILGEFITCFQQLTGGVDRVKRFSVLNLMAYVDQAKRIAYARSSKALSCVARCKARRRAIAQRWVVEYLKSHPCVVCGETDIVVLEFDHIKGKKKLGVGELVQQGYLLKWVIEEVAKCEVVCANDHRRRTCKRANHYRSSSQ